MTIRSWLARLGFRPPPYPNVLNSGFKVPEKVCVLAPGHRSDHLIGGTSIAGSAVQMAFVCGASDIILCGFDMSGDEYVDGTRNESLSHGETWEFTDNFNRLIAWLNQHTHARVRSLSPTKLQVPRC
jgi:hypothetical protein